MYNISSFSKLSNTPVQTLRYYDNLGLLNPCKIDSINNYRYYSQEELAKLVIIKNLKDMKFSLKEITLILNKYDESYLIKQKKILKEEADHNLKSIKEIDVIVEKMKNNSNFKSEMINLIKNREGSNVNMKEKYNDAKVKLMKCYEEYNKGNYEQCIESLEDLKEDMFISNSPSLDPYWPTAAGDLFTGITFEIFKNSDESEVNFLNIVHFNINGNEFITNLNEYTNSLEKDSYSYLCLSQIIIAPSATMNSVISVFQQTMKPYAMYDTKTIDTISTKEAK